MPTSEAQVRADPESLIVRVYQPTETALNVTVQTAAPQRFPASWPLDLHGRTALESALPAAGEARLGLAGTVAQFSFTAARALTTVAVGKRPSGARRMLSAPIVRVYRIDSGVSVMP